MNEMVMRDDNCGFSDQVGCCPFCEEPLCIPLDILFAQKEIKETACQKCGELVKLR